MGSYRNAIMTGFICRLCSEQKKCVIHLYSSKGREMSLVQKIAILPINVKKYDHLPKTICESCIEKVNMQYNLLQKINKSLEIQRAHIVHQANGNCPTSCPMYTLTITEETSSNEDVQTNNEQESDNLTETVEEVTTISERTEDLNIS